jgi:hypothetical protein
VRPQANKHRSVSDPDVEAIFVDARIALSCNGFRECQAGWAAKNCQMV